MSALAIFLSGAIMLASWAAGVFFFRFWSKTHDRLFFLFGTAFWILALERCVLVALNSKTGDDSPWIYLLRLLAFIVILSGIIDKNRQQGSQ